jgi:hypothetical protein
MYIGLHVKYPLFLSDYNQTLILLTDLMKIHPLGAELFHADGWTDMAILIVAFHNFANTPINELRVLLY